MIFLKYTPKGKLCKIHKKGNGMKNLFYLFICLATISANVFCQNQIKTTPSTQSPLILVSIPKSGTHLLSSLVKQITKNRSKAASVIYCMEQHEIDALESKYFYFNHAPCTENNYSLALHNKAKIILLIRDPRDVLISLAHWLKKTGHLGAHFEPEWPKYKDLPVEEIITQFIKQYPTIVPPTTSHTTVTGFYNLYLPWQNYPDVLVTSFEKLVGPQGGGDKTVQEDEIMRIAQFLNTSIERSEASDLSSMIFGGTNTFRAGRIGSWRDTLTAEQIKMFKNIDGFNKLLINLNYEKDDKW